MTLRNRWPLALFAVLWFDLVRQLGYTWENREQYSYGWFVPLFALYLGWRRWTDRPTAPAPLPSSPLTLLVSAAALALIPLRVIYEINPDWPLVSWIYTISVTGLTLYAIWLAGGGSWVRHFAFPVLFILVAVEWPYRVEKRLTQDLMQVIASLTVECLGFLGVPALQRGNLIEVSTGVVGVDEACSGIRSFQSCLMASLMMGELYRFMWRGRVLMLGIGLTLAFGFNLLRTLFLSWQASQHGMTAVDRWHDSAGMTILVACLAVLWGVASYLRSRAVWTSCTTDVSPPKEGPFPNSARRFLAFMGCVILVALATTEAWYRAHAIQDEGSFSWTVAFPTNNAGFAVVELPPRTKQLINADIMSAGQWQGTEGAGWSAYFFRWSPASIASVLRARIHRPDRCLPAAGFRQVADEGIRHFEAAGLQLPFRRYTYEDDHTRIHVFFCQWEDGHKTQSGLETSHQVGRLQSVLNGRRKLGQQTLEFILTGCTSQQQADALVAREIDSLIQRDQQKQKG